MPKTSDNLVVVEIFSHGEKEPIAMGRIDSTLLNSIIQHRQLSNLILEIKGEDYEYLSHKIKFGNNSIFTEASVVLEVNKLCK